MSTQIGHEGTRPSKVESSFALPIMGTPRPHGCCNSIFSSFGTFLYVNKALPFLVDKGCSPLWWPLFTGLIKFLSASRQSLVASQVELRTFTGNREDNCIQGPIYYWLYLPLTWILLPSPCGFGSNITRHIVSGKGTLIYFTSFLCFRAPPL